MLQIEQVDQRNVFALHQINFQIAQKAADRQPKIIPDQHDALQPATIALSQGPNQHR